LNNNYLFLYAFSNLQRQKYLKHTIHVNNNHEKKKKNKTPANCIN